MATTNELNKLTKDERQTIINALDLLITSLVRSAKAGRSAAITAAFETEAQKAKAIQAKVASGTLDL